MLMTRRQRESCMVTNAANLMKTDIQEYDDGYQLEIDLPGFKKDEVQVELRDGYLVSAPRRVLTRTRKIRRVAST